MKKICIYYEMAKLSNKKQKHYAFTKKTNLVGSTPDAVAILEVIIKL